MSIAKIEIPFMIGAKTIDYDNRKSISYYFLEYAHSLCFDKIEIISAQIQACKRLLNYTNDEVDMATIEKESGRLKFALDLHQLA